MSERVPPGWILDQEVLPDGTVKKFYHKPTAGQRFETKEEVARYEYWINIHPRLEGRSAFKRAYKNEKDGSIERPWETDPKYKIHDYLLGRVGKLKGEETSCVTEIDEMPIKENENENEGNSECKGKGKKK